MSMKHILHCQIAAELQDLNREITEAGRLVAAVQYAEAIVRAKRAKMMLRSVYNGLTALESAQRQTKTGGLDNGTN